MTNLIFSTGGDWDSTTLFDNGEEVLASELRMELHAGRDAYGDPIRGGVAAGGQFEAYIRTQDNPDAQAAIFPGRMKVIFPGHEVIVENLHPAVLFEFTRIWYNGQDVTENVLDYYLDVDADQDAVKSYITLYRPHWLTSDEIATYNIFG